MVTLFLIGGGPLLPDYTFPAAARLGALMVIPFRQLSLVESFVLPQLRARFAGSGSGAYFLVVIIFRFPLVALLFQPRAFSATSTRTVFVFTSELFTIGMLRYECSTV